MGNDIKVNIYVDDVKKYTEESILQALETIGLKAESYAKMKCPVDTGLLRNSITHAVAGEQVSISTYSASRPDEEGNIKSGTYTAHAPGQKGEYRIYIGTNVEYAPYVEMGHKQQVGRFVPKLGKRLKAQSVKAQPYIRPAIMDHMNEYEQILKNTLREAFENKK